MDVHANMPSLSGPRILKREREEEIPYMQCAQEVSDDESYFSDDEDDDDSFGPSSQEQEDEETRIAKALVRAAFDGTLTEPVLKSLIASSAPPSKKMKRDVSLQAVKVPMRVTKSAPALSALASMPLMRKEKTTTSSTKPQDFLRALLNTRGKSLNTVSALDMKDFFVNATEEAIKGYDIEITKATREENVEALRKLHKNGKVLQCANRFGESIVHIACRRGSLKTLQFLLNEANVSCRVCCDYGRTSLHDACWTSVTNFEVISFLLDACPDLLYMKDRRGFTPLDYVRPGEYEIWCDYLSRRGVSKLLPKEIV